MDDQSRYHRDEYIARINRVIDYIEKHIDTELTLKKLSDVANFSSFHFHRIFRALVGETLNAYIRRVRIERAASQLIHNPGKTITEIALDCGFSGSASFARAFREYYGMSASEWRLIGNLENSKNGIQDRKNRKTKSKLGNDMKITSGYGGVYSHTNTWRIKMQNRKDVTIEVKNMPEFHVAYVRHIGPYAGNPELFEGLFAKLMAWAGPRDLLQFPETRVICAYHDDPEITEEEKLRTSACITVPKDTPVDGEVGYMTIPGGKFAVGRFELAQDEYEDAWKLVFGAWLPESGYQPDDRLFYELYHNDPKDHPENKCVVDICVPIRPL
ncbi:MAG: AraC family transcriptional regulator [Deltaproteobacteria bacterium]|nr:AraC family transcriptional regulator [Candidatus Zymogenaceae bacterium]